MLSGAFEFDVIIANVVYYGKTRVNISKMKNLAMNCYFTFHIYAKNKIFTGRQRRCGKGYAFTRVCQAFCPQGTWVSISGAVSFSGGGYFHGVEVIISGPMSFPGFMSRDEYSPRLSVCTHLPLDTWTRDTTGYGSQVGSTHPTGILSCVLFYV